MDFDYLLKPGVITETNALAIASMMGPPDRSLRPLRRIGAAQEGHAFVQKTTE